jgi:predicted O-methyltransferase YrrM
MVDAVWTAVDGYVERLLVAPDAGLTAALEASRAAGLPEINVTPAQGKFLHLIARIQQARRILEIGTLGGYSTIWLARALQAGGKLVTIEIDQQSADIARRNIERAGVSGVVEQRIGAALDVLPGLRGAAPFDLVFIDADKENTPAYLRHAVDLSRAGTLIVVDNVVRDGKLADEASDDPRVQAMQRSVEVLSEHPAIDAAIVQTVGAKGYDGFAIAIVTRSQC